MKERLVNGGVGELADDPRVVWLERQVAGWTDGRARRPHSPCAGAYSW